MRRVFYIFLLIILCSCHKEAVYLPELDSGHSITLDIGQTAVITLAENRTTGYSWELEIEPKQQNVIGDIKEKYIHQQTKLIGAGGIKEFRFKAESAGKIVIKAYYRRLWENVDENNLHSVTYTIIAE